MCLSQEITRKSWNFSIQNINYKISLIKNAYKKTQRHKILRIWWIRGTLEWNLEF